MAVISSDRVLDVSRTGNRFIEACTLDREVDVLLQQGFRQQAEWLSHKEPAMREVAAATMTGDVLPARPMKCAVDAVARIESAPRRKAVLCAGCDRTVKGTAFSVAVIMGEVDSPHNAIVHAVCPWCASTPDKGKVAALAAIKRIWPDARRVQVTHEGGKA